MKALETVKPLKPSAAALKRNIRKMSVGKNEIVSVLSLPPMIYLVTAAARNDISEIGNPVFNIALRKSESNFGIAAYFRALFGYGANAKGRRSGYLSESLFKSYNSLNRLTQALWSIYKSNDLRLSHSLLALIKTINEKNGTELDDYFGGLPKILWLQKKIISALKSIDRSLFGRIYLRDGNSSIVSIGKREIYRRTAAVNRVYGETRAEILRFNGNIFSMTPLLMRIYEGIETGIYLYNADSYRSAKTLQRLTNSLWRVYLGQNMELSRSFSRLITRINQENKSYELRGSENNMFPDNRSLKNLVNALRKAFSGSNIELRSSMISLFGDIHKAGIRKNITVSKHYGARTAVGIIILHRQTAAEYGHTRLYHKRTARLDRSEHTDIRERFERDINTRMNGLETASVSEQSKSGVEDIVKDVLEKINQKQQLDWRLEKLQRGIF